MIHVIGGGTFSHVRAHLALAAPAFGQTARHIHARCEFEWSQHRGMETKLHLTKMADHTSKLVTNEDVAALIDTLVADPATRVIYMNAALCDYEGSILEGENAGLSLSSTVTRSGKYADRLKTADGLRAMLLTPADKLLGRIRKERKDIFVVAFKTTSGAMPEEQYSAALNLLKANSVNLVLANDLVTRYNMIVTPEETYYSGTNERNEALDLLVTMTQSRSQNTFTRSTVVPGEFYRFQSDLHVPENLRQVMNHMVARGAYKPFRGATVGHFAVKLDDQRVLTSRRKSNFTEPGGLDLVEIEYEGRDKVTAFGAKPSVGGQSQRIIFDEHPDLECIAHAHVPLRANAPDFIAVANQWPNECGSHQCGETTSRNLRDMGNGIHAVMLHNHGPNIVFDRTVPAERVIDFIERNFDLEAKTGGFVPA